jgi:hypothetical protein
VTFVEIFASALIAVSRVDEGLTFVLLRSRRVRLRNLQSEGSRHRLRRRMRAIATTTVGTLAAQLCQSRKPCRIAWMSSSTITSLDGCLVPK